MLPIDEVPELQTHIVDIERYESQIVSSIGKSEITRNGLAASTDLKVFVICPIVAAPQTAKMEPASTNAVLPISEQLLTE